MSYQDNAQTIMTGLVQWNAIKGQKAKCGSGIDSFVPNSVP